MRITPWGNVGIGDSFSNALQPHRRTVVHQRTDSAQFRIAYTLDDDPVLGAHADFQVGDSGYFYIKPRENGKARPTAIGFLEGEDVNSPVTQFTRLDVGGVTRIRKLPNDTARSCLIIGTIADTSATANDEDHYLSRIDFTGATDSVLSAAGTWVPAADCRWEDIVSATGVGNSDIRTGFDPQDDCYRQNVIIGAAGSKSKLAVEARTERDNSPVGVLFDMTDSDPGFNALSNNGIVTALVAVSSGINAINSYAGIQSTASFGKYAVGIDASAGGGGQNSIGVYSKAGGSLNPNPGANIGVYSEVPNAADVNYWAVGGFQIVTSSPINISDESVKTNIEEIVNASEILSQLIPKTYNFVSPENRHIGFQEGLQYGLIAQEVQAVLPDIVKETTVPEIRDSLGRFIEGTSVDLLGVQYDALIPILIAGFQEQNAEMAAQVLENEALLEEVNELKTQMAAMQEQMTTVMTSFQSTQSKMNNCCGTTPTEKDRSETGAIKLEQNFPNPFEDVTIINFSINETAQIRLEISDAQGRVLEVLVSQRMEEGEYTERWDASAFAPGTYYYSLYADTELLTKKMIKK